MKKRKILSVALTVAVSISMTVVAIPQSVSAASVGSSKVVSQIAKNTKASLNRLKSGGNLQNENVFRSDSSASKKNVHKSLSLPARYDLRENGVVTPVKFQNPWGTCWAFGATTAAETSILSKQGTTYKDSKLDLSEHHLGWFTRTPIASGDQKGEGMYNSGTLADPTTKEGASRMEGGFPFYVASLYANGTGPVAEASAPYKNKAGKVTSYNGTPICYSEDGDWSVPESKRFSAVYELNGSSVIPSPAILPTDENGNLTGSYSFDETALDSIKRELKAGRAVEVCFCAGKTDNGDIYFNEKTSASYAYEPAESNHSVCIVGWDDNYSKDNFRSKDDAGNAVNQPPGNGAFIVKNSWGAASNKFPNKTNWGDDGYFYLSYYDESINCLETYDFITDKTEIQKDSGYYDNEYDLMPVAAVNNAETPSQSYMANVFTAEGDQNIRAISCETSKPGTTVMYELYKLRDNATDPEDGELMYTTQETYQYGGYHKINFNKNCQVKKGEKFSVVIAEKTTDNQFIVQTNEGLSKTGAESLGVDGYNVGVINSGESYLYSGGEWSDWKDVSEDIIGSSDDMVTIDNFSIKAYGDPTVSVAAVSGVKAVALGSAKAKVTWSKASGVTGYQVAVKKAGGSYAYSKVGKSVTGKTFKKLTKGKKYSFKVRAYRNYGSKAYYGKWSAAKTIKIK